MTEADVQALVVLNARLMQSVLQLERQVEHLKQTNAQLAAKQADGEAPASPLGATTPPPTPM